MFRSFIWFLAIGIAGYSQSPETFFQTSGANFRGTAPETRLYWQPHIKRSYARILQAADLAEGSAVATVLGSGVAVEIPLAELARRFDRLVLVDMDGASMLESLRKVPLNLRSKVELRVMDVTSFAAPLMERINTAIDASSSADEAFGRLATIFDELRLGNPVNLPPSDLVVSSLVLSEIPRFPFSYAGRLVSGRFGVALQRWEGSNRAFSKLVMLAIQDHVRLLASLVRPGGAIYYSDTLARGPDYRGIPATTRTTVESAVATDFRRLGLASSAGEIGPAIEHLCEAEHSIQTEVEAYEQLLAAYWRAGEDTFEPLLPLGQIQQEWERHRLRLQGAPVSWWWLAYPCNIARGPGAFRVTSWILRRESAVDRSSARPKAGSE